jgi:hypothetical protein
MEAGTSAADAAVTAPTALRWGQSAPTTSTTRTTISDYFNNSYDYFNNSYNYFLKAICIALNLFDYFKQASQAYLLQLVLMRCYGW